MQTFRKGGNSREGQNVNDEESRDEAAGGCTKQRCRWSFVQKRENRLIFLFYKNEAENTITDDVTIIIIVAPIVLALSNQIIMDGERAQR